MLEKKDISEYEGKKIIVVGGGAVAADCAAFCGHHKA